MIQKVLKQALGETLTLKYASMLDIDEALLTHAFSPSYIKRRDNLISRRSNSFYALISTTERRAACFMAAFFISALTTVFSVEAFRFAFVDFAFDVFATYTVFQSTHIEDAPETIEEIYEITYDMSGFESEFLMSTEEIRVANYVNYEELKQVSFSQYTKHNWNPVINTEDAILEEFQIGEIKGIYFLDNNDHYTYVWESDDYIFCIYSNLDKETISYIIISVQLVDY